MFDPHAYGILDLQDKIRGPVCSECGYQFLHRETVYQQDDELLCADCLRDRIEQKLEYDLDGLAEALGYSPTEYDAREGHL